MVKYAAVKNVARARQAETGESYAEARAAVVAKHDAPIMIRVWFPEMHRDFALDTPEARRAWRELDKDDSDELDNFAQNYLGDSLTDIGADQLECDYFGDIAVEISKGYRFPADDATWVSKETGKTVTPEQVEWLVDHYGIPESDEFCGGPDLDVVVQVLDRLPAELATSAILARYAVALAEDDPSAVQYRWPRSLLVSAVENGLRDGNPANRNPVGWPSELERITAIMRCASDAGDVAVLHECIDILTNWFKRLADWTVDQPEYI
jgi:hypothetical protein